MTTRYRAIVGALSETNHPPTPDLPDRQTDRQTRVDIRTLYIISRLSEQLKRLPPPNHQSRTDSNFSWHHDAAEFSPGTSPSQTHTHIQTQTRTLLGASGARRSVFADPVAWRLVTSRTNRQIDR